MKFLNPPCPWIEHDGGRKAAGFIAPNVGDCAVRAISIACEIPYKKVYADLKRIMGKGESPRNGVFRETMDAYLCGELGHKWVPVMSIGTGCTMHLRKREVPDGRIIARVSQHYIAIVNRVMYDTMDHSRAGSRCVYGYYRISE